MRFNQFSYLPTPRSQLLDELESLGLKLSSKLPIKRQFEDFIRWSFFTYTNTDYALSTLAADRERDLMTFFQSDKELTADIFYTVVFQLLGFNYLIDFEDAEQFRKETEFPIIYGDLIENLYHLLNTRTKKGNTLIDQLVGDGLIAEDNHYHYFNGKSLATFSSHDVIREVVYVESRVDTDKDGLPDLVKVSIIRPRYQGQVPTVMTASPYHQGTNDPASDKALHDMNVDLAKKEPHQITVQDPELKLLQLDSLAPAQEVSEAERVRQ